MSSMHAIQIERVGDPSVLRPVVIERPTPAADEVLVRVTRVGLNFAETLQRAGTYPGPALTLPAVPGSEVVGTVAAVGANVRDIRIGARVAAPLFGAMRATGGYAEYVTLGAALITAIPDEVSDDDAVAVMLQGLVARVLLRETPVAARTVAITAAAGGVGSMLIQLARLDGARSITGLAGAPAKLHAVRTLGADRAISYRDAHWADQLSDATGREGPDVVFDSIGGTVARDIGIGPCDIRPVRQLRCRERSTPDGRRRADECVDLRLPIGVRLRAARVPQRRRRAPDTRRTVRTARDRQAEAADRRQLRIRRDCRRASRARNRPDDRQADPARRMNAMYRRVTAPSSRADDFAGRTAIIHFRADGTERDARFRSRSIC